MISYVTSEKYFNKRLLYGLDFLTVINNVKKLHRGPVDDFD